MNTWRQTRNRFIPPSTPDLPPLGTFPSSSHSLTAEISLTSICCKTKIKLDGITHGIRETRPRIQD